MASTWTNKEFLRRLTKKYGSKYIPLEPYTDSSTKMQIRCTTCDNVWNTTSASLLRGKECPECGRRKKMKSQEQFLKEFNKKHHGKYSIISTYTGYAYNLRVKCNNCGTEWEDKACNLLKGSICPNCGKHEKFLEKLKKVHGEKFTPLEKYIHNKSKIKVRCNDCGNEWLVKPKQLLEGKGCPECLRLSLSKTHEQFTKEIQAKYGNKYILLGKYINNTTTIDIKCTTCGNVWSPLPTSILRGKGCPECARIELTKTNEDFLKDLNKIHGNKYTPLEEYKTFHEPISFRCNTCGHIWPTMPSNILRCGGCPKCADIEVGKKKALTNEEFLQKLKLVHGGRYIPLEPYVRGTIKIKVKCSKCNTVFRIEPGRLLGGQGCSNCNKSKGESRIQFILDTFAISNESQKTFIDCIHIRSLPFDFAILVNNVLVGLIEYDGIQHYRPVEAFGGKDGFEYTKKHDSIKTNYCKDNNIPLLRVPYWRLNSMEGLILPFLIQIGAIKKDKEKN